MSSRRKRFGSVLPFSIGRSSDSNAQASSGEDKPSENVVNTAEEVRAWLQTIGYPQYCEIFVKNEINGAVLKTITSEELRDDLYVTNLRHRRDILDAIAVLFPASSKERLPEHGRILDHLSNVRTYHSWIRVGVQFLAFAIVTLRLAPNFRPTGLVSAASIYYAVVGILALVYGVVRYKAVIHMIEESGPSSHSYKPDRYGVLSMVVLVLIASTLSLAIIGVRSS